MIEFKKVELPFTTDLIAAKFDNVLELLHPNAFVYGGVVRDIAAGMELEGDLDIVATGQDYDYCMAKIGNSSKWRSVHNSHETLDKKMKYSSETMDYNYNRSIRRVSTFETFGNRKVELVKAEIKLAERSLTAALEVIKTVDIVCCGMAMDIYGNTYEIVKGAHQDCLDRLLKLHNLNPDSDIENLKSRIKKLEKRGWTSKINLDKANKMLAKIRTAAQKEFSERTSRKRLVKKSMTVNIHHEKSYIQLVAENVNTKGAAFTTDGLRDVIHMVLESRKSKVRYSLKEISAHRVIIEIGPVLTNKENKEGVERTASALREKIHEYFDKCVGQEGFIASFSAGGGTSGRTQKQKEVLKSRYETKAMMDAARLITAELSEEIPHQSVGNMPRTRVEVLRQNIEDTPQPNEEQDEDVSESTLPPELRSNQACTGYLETHKDRVVNTITRKVRDENITTTGAPKNPHIWAKTAATKRIPKEEDQLVEVKGNDRLRGRSHYKMPRNLYDMPIDATRFYKEPAKSKEVTKKKEHDY